MYKEYVEKYEASLRMEVGLRACNKTLPEIRSDHLSVLLFCRFTEWARDSTKMNPFNFPDEDFELTLSSMRAMCLQKKTASSQ
jgi:hypothetical protein